MQLIIRDAHRNVAEMNRDTELPECLGHSRRRIVISDGDKRDTRLAHIRQRLISIWGRRRRIAQSRYGAWSTVSNRTCWDVFFTKPNSQTVTEALVLRPLLEDRGRITVNPYPGARRQNETKMFSDHDETSPSIAAVSAPSVACSMLAVQQ